MEGPRRPLNPVMKKSDGLNGNERIYNDEFRLKEVNSNWIRITHVASDNNASIPLDDIKLIYDEEKWRLKVHIE